MEDRFIRGRARGIVWRVWFVVDWFIRDRVIRIFMKFTKSNILVAIAAVMVTGYLTANVMATQIIQIGSLSIFDAGTIIFPITYM